MLLHGYDTLGQSPGGCTQAALDSRTLAVSEHIKPQIKRSDATSSHVAQPDLQLRSFDEESRSADEPSAIVSQASNAAPEISPAGDAACIGHSFSQVRIVSKHSIQPKLTIGQPDDVYEQDADRTAAEIMQMPTPLAHSALQRQDDGSELTIPMGSTRQHQDDEPLLPKAIAPFIPPIVQRSVNDDDPLQRSPNLQQPAASEPLTSEPLTSEQTTPSSSLDRRLSAQSGAGSALSSDVRSFMEPRFGFDFSQVRVHTDSEAVQMNRELSAQAFAHGHDIYFGSGTYEPGSEAGKTLLAHELTHVVQQTGEVQAKHSPVSPRVQRIPVAPVAPPVAPTTPAAYHGASDIYAMTLNAFNTYAEQQADWINSPAPNELSPGDRRILRRILEFGRSPYILSGCGEMTVQALKDKGTAWATLDGLRVYSRAVEKGIDTVELEQTTNVDEALDLGSALKKLERTPGGSIIKRVIRQDQTPPQFQRLMAADGGVDAFMHYYTTCHPSLEANNGAEIDSYLALLGESVHPESYRGRLQRVRNFHRFEKAALEQLVLNQRDTSKTKPLALILHSALDHNGAFHRDAALTNAITDSRNLTLMIEGVASLAEVQHELRPLARRYGQGDRISQVMIAGHGSSRTIELAGTVDSAGEAHGDALDLDRNAAHTDAFFRELLRNMDSSPNSRIVFNACLTAANEVNAPVDAVDPAVARTQINDAIRTHPSLVTRLRQIATDQGVTTSVVGASGSFTEGPQLIDPATGRFDIIPAGGVGSSGDAHLTDADKFNYVRHGRDPEGALRAVVECWATDEVRCIQLVQERHTELASATSWKEHLIHACYGIILANPRNAALMNNLAWAVYTLDELSSANNCTTDADSPASVSAVHGLHHTLNTHLHTLLAELASIPPNSFSRLVLYQAWMLSDTSKRSDFLTQLSSIGNCNSASSYVDTVTIGDPQLTALLPLPATAGSAPQGELMLALIGVEQGNTAPGAPCREYLRAAIGSTSRTFPASLGVSRVLGGLSNEPEILRRIGLGPAAAASTTPGSPPPPAPNVDLDSDGTNDFYVEPLTRRGGVTARMLNVRQRPGITEPVVGGLPSDRQVFIIGQSEDWYAIEYHGGTAFVFKHWIRLMPVLL